MIAAAPMLAEIYLSLAAVFGLLTLRWVLVSQDGWDPINRRFLFGVRVTIALFVGRLLQAGTGAELFRIVELMAAGLIPLAVLLLTEGLLRRHAPFWIKTFVAGGTALFVITAFWYSDSVDPPRLIGLLAFQMVGFCLAGWLIVTRDRASLSAGENVTVARLGFSLLVFIPLGAGDFLLIYWGLPIQFSALGVLILCWLAIGLSRAHAGHGMTLLQMGMTILASVVLGGLIGVLVAVDRDGVLVIIALIMSTLFLAAAVSDARNLQNEAQRIGLLRHMATARVDEPVGFLRDLRAHPLVEGAVILRDENLSDLDAEVIDRIFAAAPVLRKAAPPALGATAEEHITYLFDRYRATHIMRVADAPRILVALSMPSLNTSPNTELELEVVQRMAALISGQAQPPL
ncbi:hypothetical protein [Yoonia sp. 2307UL14-13]|uniref:hypothetical protein n=1 Tax=Yoonia sp. 2307UL14-13 TaxID=3126506 RepID=UPI0030AA03AB